MRKVNNRKVIRRIADKTRKGGKNRNLIAILAIALTTVLFTSVFTVGGSMLEKQQEETMRQVGGNAQAGFKYLTQEEYDIVKKDKKLKEVSYRIVVGDAVNDELKKLHTEISYYEDLDAKMSFCYPEKGKMPKAEDEIVASDLVLNALGVPCRIGEKVPVVIQSGNKTFEKTFTLSGYFKGDMIAQSQVMAVSKEYAGRVAPTPTESAMDTQIDANDYPGRIMADFNFATSFNLEKQTAELAERCGFPEDIDTGINWAYMGGKIDTVTLVLVVTLLVVIFASGYLIIYNIFYINVYHDIRHYGLLKTVGTTGKQLRKIVHRQAYMLCLYGIPLGLTIGAVVGKSVLPMIMSGLTFSDSTDTEVSLRVWIFAGAALFSFITVYLSCIKPCRIASKVSPVEAVRYTEGQSAVRIRKKGKKTRRVRPETMAVQNIRRNKKKVVVVVASLSMALVLLNSIYSLIRGFDMDKFVASMTISDFSVTDATLDNLSVNWESIVKDGVTEKFLEDLGKQKGVEETGNIYMKEVDPVMNDAMFSKVEERIFDNPATREVLTGYENNIEEGYLDSIRKDRFIDGKIYGISELIMKKLEDVDGELSWEKFRTGKYTIATRFGYDDSEADYFRPGEMVTVGDKNGEQREYEVLAVANLPHAAEFQHYGLFECNFLLPEDEYLDLMGQQQPMRTLFNVKADQEENMEAWLSHYCEEVNPDLTYTSKASIVREFDSVKNMYSTVGGLLALILALIGILNFVNTMVTSVMSRKQEFAMMEAIGMTGAQLRGMLCFEGICYAVLTAIVAVSLSGILSVTAVQSFGKDFFFFTWRFTELPVLVCIPVLFIIVLIVPSVCYGRMERVSVVERMRREE